MSLVPADNPPNESAPPIGQRTLLRAFSAQGVGLHSGRRINLRVSAGEPNTGIVFIRTDLPAGESGTDNQVLAHVSNVVSTSLSTTLARSGAGQHRATVSTVEHLMAALAGFDIDNARIEVDGPELPIMDGSAAPFLVLLKDAGARAQDAPRRFLRVTRQVRYTEGDVSAQLEPYDGFRVAYTLVYDHPVFRSHTTQAVVDFSGSTFDTEVSAARTFGFLDDFEKLQEMNLARGGSLDNAVVVDGSSILNADGLRSEDEFVKHKILDAVGDLYLLGCPVIGSFTGHKSGHGTNNRLLRMLLDDPDAFEYLSYADDAQAPAVARGGL